MRRVTTDLAMPPRSDHQYLPTPPNDAISPGGTANLAVLGGNLPPSQTFGNLSPFSERAMRRLSG